MEAVPVVDISGWVTGDAAGRAAIADQVDRAGRAVGFLKISGHGVPGDLIQRFEQVTTEFFAGSREAKLALRSPDPNVNRGYSPMGSEALAYSLGRETPTDLFEAFNAGTEAFDADDPYVQAESHRMFAPNRWPDEPADMHAVWVEYMNHMRLLAQQLLEIFAAALGQPTDFFTSRADRAPDVLRAINYRRAAGEPDPLPGQMRLGAHTDYGTCTVLLADEVPGLQILDPAGEWIDVIPSRGTFLVNIGDLVAAWTNDAWRSTLHRVVPPARQSDAFNHRRSYAYFHEANYDVTVAPLAEFVDREIGPRYEPFTVADHLTGKLASSRALEPLRTVSTTGSRDRQF